MPDINGNSGEQMRYAVKSAASVGLVVQSACIEILRQPALYLPPELQREMPDVNGYIGTARCNAGKYLDVVQPRIIAVITDVSGFCKIFNVMANKIGSSLDAWSAGSTEGKNQALEMIAALKQAVGKKQAACGRVVAEIGEVMELINGDVAHFKEVSQACEERLTGDKGALKELNKEISNLDKRIAGASVGVGLGGFAIAGGVLMILVGSIASFVTAGTSAPLVVAGAVVAGGGTAAVVASSVSLADLIKTKGQLLKQKAILNSYANALTGCKSNVDLLSEDAKTAADTLATMRDTWAFLGGDLEQVEGMLRDAKTSADVEGVQGYFESAKAQWKSVDTDIGVIKKQMADVKVRDIPGVPGTVDSASGEVLGEINGDSVRRMIAA